MVMSSLKPVFTGLHNQRLGGVLFHSGHFDQFVYCQLCQIVARVDLLIGELRERFRKNEPRVPNLTLGIDMNDKSILRIDNFGKPEKPVVPLWFGWSGADVHGSTLPVVLKVGEVESFLRIEAIEQAATNPRKVSMSFQAAK